MLEKKGFGTEFVELIKMLLNNQESLRIVILLTKGKLQNTLT